MKKLIIAILFTCACFYSQAQVNFVKNPGFEQYSSCPNDWNQVIYANFWSGAIDSGFVLDPEYYNSCAGGNIYSGLPLNVSFRQYPHSGNGMTGATFFYDGSPPSPPSPLPSDYRDYIQGRLHQKLTAGKSYCVTFFVNLTEASGYAHNKIGAFLDDGSFDDTISTPGRSLTFVIPQIYSTSILNDTANWEKVEGSFVAKGNEKIITIGNFFKNTDISYIVTNHWHAFETSSYYLIDDVSVVETDLPADAGPDKWVPIGDSVWVGRDLDSTGWLDCKWYHKGSLIDSGAGIWAKGTTVGNTDTYTVVQTVCGLVKTDTVVVLTASVGINELPFQNSQGYAIFPNPSDGEITIKQLASGLQTQSLQVYDMIGRLVYIDINPHFNNGEVHLKLHLQTGSYLVSIESGGGFNQKLKLLIR